MNMKCYLLFITMSIPTLLGIRPLYAAGKISTPFGLISDCYYLIDMSPSRTDSTRHSISLSNENGRQQPDISFAVRAGTPQNTPQNTPSLTYPQSMIEHISALPVDDRLKRKLFIAFIIISQHVDDFSVFSTDSTVYINSIQYTPAFASSVFTVKLQGSDKTFPIFIGHDSNYGNWFMCVHSYSEGSEYKSLIDFEVFMPANNIIEEAFHNLWRLSGLACLCIWIERFFSHSQKS